MTYLLLQLHALAAARGEGRLRPELVALFTSGVTVSQADLAIPDQSRSVVDDPGQPVPMPADLSEKRVAETYSADAEGNRVLKFAPGVRGARRVRNG